MRKKINPAAAMAHVDNPALLLPGTDTAEEAPP
jgi:hypothetical protein